MILASGLATDASFVVPEGPDQANGPPVITPTKANVGDDTMDVDNPGSVGKAVNSEEVIIFDSDDNSDDLMEYNFAATDPEVEIPCAVELGVETVDLTNLDAVEGGETGTVTGGQQGDSFSTSNDIDKDSKIPLVPAL